MNILFICTHNRCRSILSEAIFNHLSDGNVRATSAGSQPAGEVHPLSLTYLQERRVDTGNLCSKSWEVFADAPPDLAITVCDSAAGESCPLWMGRSPKMHWGLPDPSKLDGDDSEKRDAFLALIDCLVARFQWVLSSPTGIDSIEQLQQRLTDSASHFPAPNFISPEV